MKMKYHIIPFLILFIVALADDNVSAQEKPNPLVYPYGGEKDSSRKEVWHLLPPLNFPNKVYFGPILLTQNIDLKSAIFFNSVHFDETHFTDIAEFYYAQFYSKSNFNGSQFDDSTSFNSTRFRSSADFSEIHFANISSFSGVQFDSIANFSGSQFEGSCDFAVTQFNGNIDFYLSCFLNGISLYKSKFKEEPNFESTTIKGTIDLSNTKFWKGVDLRRANLKSVDTIYIADSTFFPEGKLFVNWDQIKNRFHLFISNEDSAKMNSFRDSSLKKQGILKTKADSLNFIADNFRQECYQKLEIFYYRLRDNYIAQRDNASADEVVYELGKHRAEFLQEFHWKLYGWFFGFGYQPWRFLLFIVLPIILIFTLVWYWFYFELVIRIVDDKIDREYIDNPDKPGFATKEVRLLPSWKIFSKQKIFKAYNLSDQDTGLSRLSRYWHILFFSASVLMDIRFKKQWLQKIDRKNRPGEKSFLAMITFEWLLGIGLYIAFALLVKGSYFQFIKGLLGF